MKCERAGCSAETEGYNLFDYCAHCSKNLCPEHLRKGCCGHIPAESGSGEEFPFGPDDLEPETTDR
jgi:hypothetical protein